MDALDMIMNWADPFAEAKTTPTVPEEKEQINEVNESSESPSRVVPEVSELKDAAGRRPRATPEQVAILTEVFVQNPNPSQALKKELARRCSMTEKSVQIWFQNKRARSKSTRRKSSAGSFLDYRRRSTGFASMAPFAASMAGKRATLHDIGLYNSSVFHSQMQLTGQSLTIGMWSRTGCPGLSDVKFFVNCIEKTFSWQITDGGYRFRLDVPFDSVVAGRSMVVDEATMDVVFELGRAPMFFMSAAGQANWMVCADFSEHGQASTVLTHVIRGPRRLLESELSMLFKQEPMLQNLFAFNSLSLPNVLGGSFIANDHSRSHSFISVATDPGLTNTSPTNIRGSFSSVDMGSPASLNLVTNPFGAKPMESWSAQGQDKWSSELSPDMLNLLL